MVDSIPPALANHRHHHWRASRRRTHRTHSRADVPIRHARKATHCIASEFRDDQGEVRVVRLIRRSDRRKAGDPRGDPRLLLAPSSPRKGWLPRGRPVPPLADNYRRLPHIRRPRPRIERRVTARVGVRSGPRPGVAAPQMGAVPVHRFWRARVRPIFGAAQGDSGSQLRDPYPAHRRAEGLQLPDQCVGRSPGSLWGRPLLVLTGMGAGSTLGVPYEGGNR